MLVLVAGAAEPKISGAAAVDVVVLDPPNAKGYTNMSDNALPESWIDDHTSVDALEIAG